MLVRLSAIIGLLGIVLGAFGAHGLEKLLEENGRVDTWKTAALYHLVHAVVLLFLTYRRENVAKGPWIAFTIGILIFSGSLYILSVTNIGILGAITPIGGVAFMVGWLWIAIKPAAAENKTG
ncbi:MAG: DUF423 domain-containing protein [Verrucomicrobiota bacterium]